MKSLNILIRCDASVAIGLGHVTRCLVLAQNFKDKGHQVFFAMKNHTLGINKVIQQGFKVHIAPPPFNYNNWLQTLTSQLAVNIFIGDVRDGLPIQTIEQFKTKNILTVAIDEPSDYRKACDFCFYPPHAQLETLDWSGFTGKIKQGLEYVVLRPEFYKEHHKAQNKKPNILVMMGGTDPNNLTLAVVKQLLSLKKEMDINVVMAPNHTDYSFIKYIAKNVSVKSDITDMAKFLTRIDFGIISFGVSAYELLAMQTPALHVCLNDDHWQSSEFFEQQNISTRVMYTDLQSVIRSMLNNNKKVPALIRKNKIVDEVINAFI